MRAGKEAITTDSPSVEATVTADFKVDDLVNLPAGIAQELDVDIELHPGSLTESATPSGSCLSYTVIVIASGAYIAPENRKEIQVAHGEPGQATFTITPAEFGLSGLDVLVYRENQIVALLPFRDQDSVADELLTNNRL